MIRLNRAITILLLTNATCLLAFWLVPRSDIALRTVLIVVPGIFGIFEYLRARYSSGWTITCDVMTSAGVVIALLLPSLPLTLTPLTPGLEVSIGPYLEYFPDVAYAAVAGQSLFFISYAASVGDAVLIRRIRPFSLTAISIDPKYFFKIFFVLIALAWSARVVLLLTGSYYHQFRSEFQEDNVPAYSALAQLAWFGLFVVMGAWIQVFAAPLGTTRKTKWLRWACLLTGAEVIWYAPAGGREPILLLFIAIFGAYVFVRRSVPTKAVLLSLPIALGVVLFMGVYREVIRVTAWSPRAIELSEVTASVTEAKDQAGEAIVSGVWSEIISRPSEARPIAALMTGVPNDVPFQSGETYVTALWAFVPRFIYPDKPQIITPINQWFFQDEGGSSPLTLIGEGYFNFGWLGICLALILGGLLAGMYDRLMWTKMAASRSAVVWATIYGGTAVTVLRLYSQTLGIWLGIFVKAVLLALVLAWLARFFVGRENAEKRRPYLPR